MELQHYLGIVLKRWPIALACLVVTSMLTAFFALQQAPTYQSEGTYVIRPRTVDSSDGLRAMDTLVRGVEINSTYATIARSDRIRERAEEALDEATSAAGATVSGEVVTGTNILEIVVTGRDPQSVHDLAVAVGAETVAYVTELQDVYELAPLDAPEVPGDPVGPNVPLRIGMGVVFGLALGGLMALLTEVLLRALLPPRVEPARQPGRSEAFLPPDPLLDRLGPPLHSGRTEHRRSREHLRSRPVKEAQPSKAFQEKLIGALRTSRPFCVGVLWVTPGEARSGEAPGRAALEHLEALVRERMPALRAGDVAADLGDGAFALMLPDTGAEEAQDLLRAWKADVVKTAARADGHGSGPRISTRVLRYGGSQNGDGGGPTVAHEEVG